MKSMSFILKGALQVLIANILTLLAVCSCSIALPVDLLCSTTECPAHTVCRVMQVCNRSTCLAKSACLPNVFIENDRICGTQGSKKYALLVGSLSRLRSISIRQCSANVPCPGGSTCSIHEGQQDGVCCYGDPEVTSEVRPDYFHDHVSGYHVNSAKSSSCSNDQCPEGWICETVPSLCLSPPCPPRSRCKRCSKPEVAPPRAAVSCPKLPDTLPDYCVQRVPVFRCHGDAECPDSFKCCQTSCLGTKCLKPVPPS